MPVAVGDQIVTPDGMDVTVIAIYSHSGAILVEVLNGSGRGRRGTTADEIGADWRGSPFGPNTACFFSKLHANELYTSDPAPLSQSAKFSMTGRLPSVPETQTLHSRKELPNFYSQALGESFAALELRIAADASYIIPIDAADRQRLLDGLDALLSLDTLAGQPGRDAEQAAIKELADHLRKV